MTRWFNIAGPCFADEHYMIPPERRAGQMLSMLDQGRWFSFVSGWQTGKTTVLGWARQTLRAAGRHLALQVDLQTAREQPDLTLALRTILNACGRALAAELPSVSRPTPEAVDGWLRDPASALLEYLRAACAAAPRPLVLLFDEADGLVGAAMVSFLTQLRDLYLARKDAPAPHAVVLAGRHNVRDYTLTAEDRRAVAWLGTSSPFNIAVETVGLTAFTAAEVGELVEQHTTETGQRFTDAAVATLAHLSQGHPWLVNALADQCTRRDVPDRAVTVTQEHVESAKETIILERRSHIDSLIARLHESRVQRILAPMIAGETVSGDQIDDDFAYVAGLGLIRYANGRWEAANPIYREVIPRALTHARQTQLDQQTAWYVRADGSLDLPKLMSSWQEFWREDGHLAADGFNYHEAGPHLMMMAFLQRIVNGGGKIEREYALGKGALDLLVVWRTWRYAIELKQRRDTRTLAKGVAQVAGYAKSLGLKEAWLVLFDRRAKKLAWSKRLFTKHVTRDGVKVHVVGC